MLTLAEMLSQEELSGVTRRLNNLCEGLTGSQVRSRMRAVDNELEREVLDIVADVLEETDHKQNFVTYREGLSDVLPEFTESAGAQQVLRLLEERTLLSGIVAEVLDQHIGRVEVVIAGDGRWAEVT